MWTNDQGEFVRYTSGFRDHVKADGPFQPEAGRYHLYVSWACPWAHRTAIVRSLLGLEDAISLSAVAPVWNENGWTFDGEGATPDTVNGKRDLVDIYRLADPKFTEEETTPVLWDKKHKTIVNNESLEIIKMFATEFTSLAKNRLDLYPAKYRAKIDTIITALYPAVNNGVYRAGFAESQEAYESSCRDLFKALDHWEAELGKTRFLVDDRITLADVCLFTTLFRFDLVYYSHFKCNLRHVYDYPNLWGFVRDFYQIPQVAKTCFPDHIKKHYYISQDWVNPSKVVPIGPELDFTSAHHRGDTLRAVPD